MYSFRDQLAFGLGLASLCCWLCAQLPQLYAGWNSTATAEALSWLFLVRRQGPDCDLAPTHLSKAHLHFRKGAMAANLLQRARPQAQWFAGDSLNLVGCLLASQLPTQTFTAVYYLLMDLALCSQFLSSRLRTREALRRGGASAAALLVEESSSSARSGAAPQRLQITGTFLEELPRRVKRCGARRG